jgi:hypothetical protein
MVFCFVQNFFFDNTRVRIFILAKWEKKKNSKGINIGILDVQSAFDVVQHKILLDNLIDQSIHPTLWILKISTEQSDEHHYNITI